MEYVTGGALVMLGVFFVGFGNSSLPVWLDAIIKWTIGLLCVWFGAALLVGHAHFFQVARRLVITRAQRTLMSVAIN